MLGSLTWAIVILAALTAGCGARGQDGGASQVRDLDIFLPASVPDRAPERLVTLSVGTQVIVEATLATSATIPPEATASLDFDVVLVDRPGVEMALATDPIVASWQRADDGKIVVRAPWEVPDDAWDLASTLEIRALRLVVGDQRAEHRTVSSWPLEYPAPPPALPDLQGVWVGGESWAENGTSTTYAANGAEIDRERKLLVTVTLIASRGRPGSPFFQLIGHPGWSLRAATLTISGAVVTDEARGQAVGTLAPGVFRFEVLDESRPGITQAVVFTRRGRDAHGRELAHLEVEERSLPASDAPARILRRLDVDLFLKAR